MDYHQPVLLEPVLETLQPAPGKIFLDATLGHAGHTIPLLQKGCRVFGLDQDKTSLKTAVQRISALGLSSNFTPLHGNFGRLKYIFYKHVNQPLDGIIFDLGLNIAQQKSKNQGYSFNDEFSLDMRLNPKTKISAETIINSYSFPSLYRLLSTLSQEKFADTIAREIIKNRPINTAKQLADLVRHVYSLRHYSPKTDPATKTFLALKIAVNHELSNLKSALSATLKILPPKATVCFISFHSTEDRIIKKFIQKNKQKNLVETPSIKPIRPSYHDSRRFSTSRSALLRSYRIN